MEKYIMAFDEGTTSLRTIIFDKKGNEIIAELEKRMNQKVIFDGRNIYDKKITQKGFELYQIGC